MAKLVKEKQCDRCDQTLYNVDVLTKYCEECKAEVKREESRNRKRLKHEKRKQEMLENFLKVVTEPHHLTPNGFNEVSEIKVTAYSRLFKTEWINILDMFDRKEDLKQYIIEEYNKYLLQGNSVSLKNFASLKHHKYITHVLVNYFGAQEIQASSVNQFKTRYSREDLVTYFNKLVNDLGFIPTYQEFRSLSKISYNVFKRVFSDDNTYDTLMKNICGDRYDEYVRRRDEVQFHKGKMVGGFPKKYSLNDLKNEFIRVFEYSRKTFGNYPSRRLFSELSDIDESIYRARLKLSWTDVCRHYGYEPLNRNDKSEISALNLISKITDKFCIHQMKFDWLIGTNDYPLFIDGYFPEIRLAVEFDGIQHREPVPSMGGVKRFKTQQANDQIKNKLIPQHGIKLLRISSEEKWYDEDHLKQRLEEVLNG